MAVIFISGIDTDAGKTYATGMLAKYLHAQGRRFITQKLVQTGCQGLSEDLLAHRQMAGMPLFPEDEQGITCPYVFSYPASPHLAAAIDQRELDCDRITQATALLEQRYGLVLVEGAGGLHVPLDDQRTTLDYIAEQGYPIILVSSSKLGSINHTLLSLEIAYHRGLKVLGIIYNRYYDKSPHIAADSKQVFARYLQRWGFPPLVVDLPVVAEGDVIPDFTPLVEEIEALA